MAATMRDIMTPAPVCLTTADSVYTAARAMSEHETGTVLVLSDGVLVGILTDHDIAVRVLAEDRDPRTTSAGDICCRDFAVLSPGASVADAARLVRERAVRRIPVLHDGIPVGLVRVGDLTPEPESRAGLSAVPAAPARL